MLNAKSGFIEKKIRLNHPYSKSQKEPIKLENYLNNDQSQLEFPFSNEIKEKTNKNTNNADCFFLVKRKSVSIEPINNPIIKSYTNKVSNHPKVKDNSSEHNKSIMEKSLDGGVINLLYKKITFPKSNLNNKSTSIYKSFDGEEIIPWKSNECRFTLFKNKKVTQNKKMIYQKKRISEKSNSLKKQNKNKKEKNENSNIPICNQDKQNLLLSREELSNSKDTKDSKHKKQHVSKTHLSVLSPSFLSTQNNSFFGLNDSIYNNKSVKGSLILSPNLFNQKEYDKINPYNFKYYTGTNLKIFELKKMKDNTKIICPVNNPIYHNNHFNSHIRTKSFGKHIFEHLKI